MFLRLPLFVLGIVAYAHAAPASSGVEARHTKKHNISCEAYHTDFIRYYGPNGTSFPLDYDGHTAIIYSTANLTGEKWEFQACNSTYIMGDEAPASVTDIQQGHIVGTSTNLCLTVHAPFNVTKVTLEPCLERDDAKQLTQWWAWVAGSYFVLVAEPYSTFSGIIGGSYGVAAPPSNRPPFHFPLKLASDGASGYCLDFISNSSTHCSV